MSIDERPFVVALTGGIASGKSTVAEHFEALGVPVFDADVAAREVVAPDSDGLNEVIAAFGEGLLDKAGTLDRAALRRIVFADPDARARLEAIVHPRVRARLRQQVEAASAPWVLLVIPLLAETWAAWDWVDRVLLVDVPELLQLQRLVARDGIDDALARKMLQAQASRARRRALADDVIENSGPPEALPAQVARLARRYEAASRAGGTAL